VKSTHDSLSELDLGVVKSSPFIELRVLLRTELLHDPSMHLHPELRLLDEASPRGSSLAVVVANAIRERCRRASFVSDNDNVENNGLLFVKDADGLSIAKRDEVVVTIDGHHFNTMFPIQRPAKKTRMKAKIRNVQPTLADSVASADECGSVITYLTR
jgi:hypothetical protein